MSNFLLLKSLMPSTHGSPRSTVQRKNGCTCETPVTEIHHLFFDVLTWNMWRTMLICQPFSLEIWISHVLIFVQTFFQSSKTFFFGNLTERNWLILVFCIIFFVFFVVGGVVLIADTVAAFGSNLLGQLLPLHCFAKAF